ncbi:mitochondrial ubiquitin ligase activator of NFKB 1-like [Ptychodera flava]|uniref:mitochondrial ubiquitin ligase activator of NFKB 1-like n=1 Tax=Ptychodera flava TaxID=63121 RepID=UPI00396A8674
MLADLIIIGCGTAATALTWYLSQGRQQSIVKLKEAPTLNINADLKDVLRETQDKSLPYVVIEGKVAAIGEALKSEYVAGMLGVIQTIILKEHRTEWNKTTRLWYDTSRSIKDATKVIPFSLKGVDASVIVDEPLEARGLDLDTVYDKFSPVGSTFGESLVNWATGEKTKGYQDIEKLLPVGTVLTGIGKLTLEKDDVRLGPPTGNGDYILSALNKSQILKQMESKVRTWKILVYIFGTTTAVIAVACLWKWYKKYREMRLRRQQIEEIRRNRQRTNSESEQGDQAENPNAGVCVICLTNPREVVILNCGHICACADCAGALQPPHCPICRERIARINPVFHS